MRADLTAGTLLAFDYGEKRIGVALGNTVTRSAQALTTIANRSRAYRFSSIAALIKEWQPQALIVGLPLHLDGTSQFLTQQARRFGSQLAGRFNLPVSWIDERYSSVAAATLMGRLTLLDAQAACIILEQYFSETGLTIS